MTPKVDDVVKYRGKDGEVRDARVVAVDGGALDLEVRGAAPVRGALRGDAAGCWFFGGRQTPKAAEPEPAPAKEG